MIYLIYVEDDIWNICETYAELIKEVHTIKNFHEHLMNKIKIYSYNKNTDITSQVKEMINS